MKAKFITVLVKKDAMSEIVTEVPEYELALLQAVNGADIDDSDESAMGAVSKFGDTDFVHEYDNVTEVYDAMKEKYRSSPEGKMWVDEVYGSKSKFAEELKKFDAAANKAAKTNKAEAGN